MKVRDTLNNVAISILAGCAMFGFVRLSGWLGSLTTVRTPFYWTLVSIGAYVLAGVISILSFVQLEQSK